MTDALLENLDRRLATGEPALSVYKETLREAKDLLGERFEQGISAKLLVRAAARFTDAIMQRVWSRFLPEGTQASLIAVGGYGRGELHPASDVDVLILTAEDPQKLAEHLEPLVMFLWDIGLEIGHSVRSVEQCVEEATADITVITNLIESRLLAGDGPLFERLIEATGPEHIWPSTEFFSAKLAEQIKRHAKYDDSGSNLEPNIKESPGGLRDIQTIGWVAKRHFGVSTMRALVEHGFLNDHEYQQLKSGEEHLWRVRYALHLLTGRHEDRLLFEHQRVLAKQFGYTDADTNLAVEQFMQDYYRRVVEMQRLNEMLLQLFEEAILLNNQLGEPVPINRRFQARNGYLEVTNSGIFARYPLAMLELFLILQQNPQLHGRTCQHHSADTRPPAPYRRTLSQRHPRARPVHRDIPRTQRPYPCDPPHAPLRHPVALSAGLPCRYRPDAVRPFPRLHGRRTHPDGDPQHAAFCARKARRRMPALQSRLRATAQA